MVAQNSMGATIVMLPPGCTFKVVGHLNEGHGVAIVQMVEESSPHCLVPDHGAVAQGPIEAGAMMKTFSVERAVGPKPADRKWQDEYPRARVEGLWGKRIVMADMAPDEIEKYETDIKVYQTGGGESIEAWALIRGHPMQRYLTMSAEDQFACWLLLGALCGASIGRAIRDHSSEYAACTHYVSDIIRKQALALCHEQVVSSGSTPVDVKQKLYGPLTGQHYSLVAKDPYWEELCLPTCQPGTSFLTSNVASFNLENDFYFKDPRGWTTSLIHVNGVKSERLLESDIVCVVKAGMVQGKLCSPVELGAAGAAIPPMATITLEKIEEAGKWRTDGGRSVQRRLLTVRVAYDVETSAEAQLGKAVERRTPNGDNSLPMAMPVVSVKKLEADLKAARALNVASIVKAKPLKLRLTDVSAFGTTAGVLSGMLSGLEQEPLLSFVNAAAETKVCSVSDAIGALAKGVEIVKADSYGLSADEAAAIVLYTMDTPFYSTLNSIMREEKSRDLRPFLPYLKLLLNAYKKLPKFFGSLWRGVTHDLHSQYRIGDEVTWWQFTSTTKQLQTLTNPLFLGTTGKRTIFMLETHSGVDIERFSEFTEGEVLIYPGRRFKVAGVMKMAPGPDDLWQVHLQEIAFE